MNKKTFLLLMLLLINLVLMSTQHITTQPIIWGYGNSLGNFNTDTVYSYNIIVNNQIFK